MHVRRSDSVAVALVAALLIAESPRLAQAQDREACTEAYTKTQKLRLANKPHEAAASAAVCAAKSCAEWARKECATWLEELRAATPSLSVSVRDERGNVVRGARVLVDGTDVSQDSDGGPMDLEPGEHVIVVEQPGRANVERKVVLAEGEKNRRIEIVLVTDVSPGPAVGAPVVPVIPPADEYRRPIPWPTYLLAGVGLAALGVGVFTGIRGVSARDDLYGCRPTCPQDRVDSVSSKFVVTDVAVGVSLLALAGAAIFYFSRPEVSVRASSR
jgi:hypothetical protein